MDKEFKEEMKWYQSLGPDERTAYDEIHSHGLPMDYFNEWEAFNIPNVRAILDELQPILTFEEYVRSKGWDKTFSAFVLKRSNTEKVRQLDDLAAEFNLALNRIRAEKDERVLRDFYRRVTNVKKS